MEQYRAPIKREQRTFPYEGASGIDLPVTATDVDQLYAKFIQTVHAAENLWTTTPLNERWIEAAKPIQDFMTWLDGSALKMYNVNKRVLNEMVKLGTGIYKTRWEYHQKKTWDYNAEGRREQVMATYGRPEVLHVRLADFVFPPTAYSLDPDAQGGAPWVAERIRMPVNRFKWLAKSMAPYLPNVDTDAYEKVISFVERNVTLYDQAIQTQDYDRRSLGNPSGLDFEKDEAPAHVSGSIPAPNRYQRDVELWEIHSRYPTDADSDVEHDIIVWYHLPTRMVLRSVYQYYHHGKRPYDVIRYFPGDGFYGIGVCEQKEVFQRMQSDLFNFNWDNVLLANSRMVVTNSGTNIQPGEPFYPNKVWVVDGPINQSFGVFPMADIYPSLPQLQSMVQAMGERRTGISDIQLGNIQELPGRTPATTMMSLLQEGNRRPDLTVKDMRHEGLSAVGLKILQLCQQFMTSPVDVGGKRLLKVAIDTLGYPEGNYASQGLAPTIPMESVESGLGVFLTATSGSANKEVEKQNYLSLLQVSGQIAQQLVQFEQIALQFQGTPIAVTAQYAIQGILELAKRLLEQYDIRNIDRIIPPASEAPPPASEGGGEALGGQPGLGAPAAGQAPQNPAAGPLFGPMGQPPVAPPSAGLAALATGLAGGR